MKREKEDRKLSMQQDKIYNQSNEKSNECQLLKQERKPITWKRLSTSKWLVNSKKLEVNECQLLHSWTLSQRCNLESS